MYFIKKIYEMINYNLKCATTRCSVRVESGSENISELENVGIPENFDKTNDVSGRV